MKIKHQGKIPIWELDVTCEFCNTTMTLEGAQDMYAERHLTGKLDGPYPDCGPNTYYCTCPTCGKAIYVPRNDIRDDIRAKIKVKH